jgi:hypothetical protein
MVPGRPGRGTEGFVLGWVSGKITSTQPCLRSARHKVISFSRRLCKTASY